MVLEDGEEEKGDDEDDENGLEEVYNDEELNEVIARTDAEFELF